MTVEDLEPYRTIGHIAIEPEDLKKLKAEGDAVLAQYDSFRKRIQAVVWARVGRLFRSLSQDAN